MTEIPPMPVLIKDLGMDYRPTDNTRRYRFGLYRCSCGKEFRGLSSAVKMGTLKSCGCYHKAKVTKHGLTNNNIFNRWRSIIDRTENPNHNAYHRYGGRGISMCKEWREDASKFYDWSISNGYSKELQIDRIDNDGNYEPSNCRWATRVENCNNKSEISLRNSSGYKYVCWSKIHNKYICTVKGKHIKESVDIEIVVDARNKYLEEKGIKC